MTTCTHPSEQLYAWWARDDTAPTGQVLCIACSKCGQVLQGSAELEMMRQDLGPKSFDAIQTAIDSGVFDAAYLAYVGPKWPTPTMAQPPLEELEEFEEDGGCLATDGCWVETDGTCPHGHPSWLLVMGMV